ncbi:amidohydrolase [Ornithinibacillus sp. 4-3]|uniref:Amidohydrolase n=1 Tax=Ornithinibacillus sp. 4-3 TaxID=3231488 RepID=A0AB39HME7_9BACI
MSEITKLVKDLYPSLVEWRRDLHKHAESGWVEFRTASIVATKLTEWGYEVKAGSEVVNESARMGVPAADVLAYHEKRALEQGADPKWLEKFSGGFTGVVGIIDTGKPGPTIGFRFDMDALDIQESLEADHKPVAEDFVSINDKMMHACGHDSHTTIGLGAAKVLSEIKDQLSGKIKVIFQPAEEGVRGAKSMVEAGVVDDVDIFIAGHIGTGAATGVFSCASNGYLATTKLDVTFTGVASHAGGKPEEGRNALLAASSAALNLYAITRHSDGASRINVGVLEAGSGRNIIANKAFMKIETRGETTEINEFIYDRAVKVLKGAATMYDAELDIDIVGGAQTSNASPELLPFVRAQAEKVAGYHTIHEGTSAGGSEDATYMMTRVQEKGGLATYCTFGSDIAAGHHNERFDIDEDAMPLAVEFVVNCALNAKEAK